ncbi:hypothetical protein KOR34_36280 [Posidoniimonas corsicana]|uniref:Uncharacterized protein n=1 Tax=Posidoniimonas corsicana TaxID=1938618 RepID=A0A5C5V5H1_9BACT|nr:hypothetical protein KOR34_36280 [Posidoniimonas corsicana]
MSNVKSQCPNVFPICIARWRLQPSSAMPGWRRLCIFCGIFSTSRRYSGVPTICSSGSRPNATMPRCGGRRTPSASAPVAVSASADGARSPVASARNADSTAAGQSLGTPSARIGQAACAARPPPLASEMGSEISLREDLQHLIVEQEVRHQMLQPAVFVFLLLQPNRLPRLCPAILLAPTLQRRLTHLQRLPHGRKPLPAFSIASASRCFFTICSRLRRLLSFELIVRSPGLVGGGDPHNVRIKFLIAGQPGKIGGAVSRFFWSRKEG